MANKSKRSFGKIYVAVIIIVLILIVAYLIGFLYFKGGNSNISGNAAKLSLSVCGNDVCEKGEARKCPADCSDSGGSGKGGKGGKGGGTAIDCSSLIQNIKLNGARSDFSSALGVQTDSANGDISGCNCVLNVTIYDGGYKIDYTNDSGSPVFTPYDEAKFNVLCSSYSGHIISDPSLRYDFNALFWSDVFCKTQIQFKAWVCNY